MKDEDFRLEANDLLHGEVKAYEMLTVTIMALVRLAEMQKYVDSFLVKSTKQSPDHFLNKYYKLLVFLVHEFKKMTDEDPKYKELVEAEERREFSSDMGFPIDR